jgi:hypothetical protein
MGSGMFLVALLLASPSAAQDPSAPQELRATVTTVAPIFIQPGAQTPLRVAAVGTSLRVLKLEVWATEQGEWAQVEFNDPQFGRRVGWVQTKNIQIADPSLQPMDLSVKDASPRAAPAQAARTATQADPAQPDERDDFTRIYDFPMETVFVAGAQVAAMKWNVTHSDKDTGIISFKTGMNMRTWKGFEMTAVCIPLDGGKTQVSVRPQRRESGQLFSWKEGNRIASTFHKELEKRLKSVGR